VDFHSSSAWNRTGILIARLSHQSKQLKQIVIKKFGKKDFSTALAHDLTSVGISWKHPPVIDRQLNRDFNNLIDLRFPTDTTTKTSDTINQK
jgi:hypothetical protein